MTKLEEIKILNKINITALKDKGMDYKTNIIIEDILNDEACFFKMDKNDAINILQILNIDDAHTEEIYLELISSNNFYDLYKKNRIDINDVELKIKYPIYDNNIF